MNPNLPPDHYRDTTNIEKHQAALDKILQGLPPVLAAATEKIKEISPEDALAFFEEANRRTNSKDYFRDPAALAEFQEVINFQADYLAGKVTLDNLAEKLNPDHKRRIMENFFKEWCVQCPIMQLFTLPPGEGDVEDTAGALCPDELLDTCPKLLLLREVQAIKPPADWLPGDTMETYLERKNSNANT